MDSQTSMGSMDGAAAQTRVSVAIHVPQELIPPSASTSSSRVAATANGSAPHDLILGGAGYGPPLLTKDTSVQRLVSDIIQPAADGKQREHDLVCLPITNASWKARWEAMCVVGAQDEGPGSATPVAPSTYRFSLRMSSKISAPSASSANEVEAERWRAEGGFRRGEVNATRSEETQYLIGQAAEWLELDSPVEGIRFDSELALKNEISYASHLHISTVLLPPPRHPELVTEYARAVQTALTASAYVTLAVRVPVSEGPTSSAPESSSWESWNSMRSLCGYNSRLVLALELVTPLPSAAALERWKAEPMRIVLIPAHSFIPNAGGYPVLSKGCQTFLKSIFKLKPTIVLTHTQKGLHPAGGADAYAQYMRFLERRAPQATPVEQYAGAYMDHLQMPLQPLMDNLETETYSGFEADPIKYTQYEQAVYEALLDRAGEATAEIFVVGAGRGPLVAACFRASQRANKAIHVIAVEKNPNAFVILQERKALEWGAEVDLVFSDMRSFRPSVRADLIVSELLGSFGDNELSPECLDPVMRWLKPDGASIPASYTSYLAPLTSAKLHAEVAGVAAGDPIKMSEQPYVVMFQAAHILSAAGGRGAYERIAPCWDFHHPRRDVVTDEAGLPITNGHNARTAHLTFHIPEAGVLHGFAGFFDAVLYNDVTISIHPERMDVRQLSWFPIFFPLRDPLYLPAQCELDVHISRLTDHVKRRIWFEWAADSYLWMPTPPSTSASQPNGATPNPSEALSPQSVRSPRVTWGDAFASAAPSPRPGAAGASPMMQVDSTQSGPPVSRVKIGQTRLANPLGRSSWVGL